MSARCPRCHRESPDLTAFCAGCGAPLLLPDDPSLRPLDGKVELDRRAPRPAGDAPTLTGLGPPPLPDPPAPPPAPLPRAPAPPPPPPRRTAELAALERSSWDLGGGARAALAMAEPAPAPPAEAAPAEGLPDAEVEALEVHVERASAGRRVAAWLLDAVPFAAGGFALASFLLRQASPSRADAPFELEALFDLALRERTILSSVGAATVLCLAVYATLAHALGGATLGKRLLRIRVIGPDGAPPSPARSAVRSALALASAGLLGLGFLLALFTRSGRALHDFLARTWVVKAP
jgi:uncharacterized RDD family membrane protein YckC